MGVRIYVTLEGPRATRFTADGSLKLLRELIVALNASQSPRLPLRQPRGKAKPDREREAETERPPKEVSQ